MKKQFHYYYASQIRNQAINSSNHNQYIWTLINYMDGDEYIDGQHIMPYSNLHPYAQFIVTNCTYQLISYAGTTFDADYQTIMKRYKEENDYLYRLLCNAGD